MENNYSFSSYPDSHDSSPRSREIDCENPSWDELPSNYKVKLMCSYGGKIQPRAHDNLLAYVGGETKILAVDRGIRFSDFMSKLSSLCGSDVCFKYQLPGEDLDALISVTNDEDLEHMMLEYDRLYRASAKPARLRLFLFPVDPSAPAPAAGFGTADPKSERQWFVDALNSVQIQNLEASSPPASAVAVGGNPDFLFGFDKGIPPNPTTKLHDPSPPTVPDAFPKDIHVGLDPRPEDRHVIGDPSDIQRQIQELQRLQIASQEQQAMFQRKSEESNLRAYPGDCYSQKLPETVSPAPPPVPATLPAGAYWQERHLPPGGGYGSDQPLYIIPTPGGYQAAAVGPVTGHAGQAYYGVPRMGPVVYREQPVYNSVSAAPRHHHQQQQQQPTMAGYGESMGSVRSSGVGATTVVESGYTQVPYDGVAGRQVYYTAATGGGVPPYQAVSAVATAAMDGRQGGVVVSQEGKVMAKAPPQASSV